MAKPKADPTHRTLKPDGGDLNKGTYYRRLEDIGRALRIVDGSKVMPGGQFLYLYYGCEKLGKGIVGIDAEWPADEAYEQGLKLDDLKAAAKSMALPVTGAELDLLFASRKKTSARYLRNEIVHNFGPSNMKNAIRESVDLNKRMHGLLTGCTPAVLAYLKASYSHLLP